MQKKKIENNNFYKSVKTVKPTTKTDDQKEKNATLVVHKPCVSCKHQIYTPGEDNMIINTFARVATKKIVKQTKSASQNVTNLIQIKIQIY